MLSFYIKWIKTYVPLCSDKRIQLLPQGWLQLLYLEDNFSINKNYKFMVHIYGAWVFKYKMNIFFPLIPLPLWLSVYSIWEINAKVLMQGLHKCEAWTSDPSGFPVTCPFTWSDQDSDSCALRHHLVFTTTFSFLKLGQIWDVN